MEILGNDFGAKGANKFYCKNCDYECSKKYSWDRHLLTAKHAGQSQGNQGNDFGAKKGKISFNFTCEICDKTFQTNAGLWKHKNKNICTINESKEQNAKKDELIDYLIKENKEIKELILEIIKKDSYSNCNNTTTTNSHNKAFNLNFFLNETCKDAMNIMEFVDSIKLQLSDLENVGEVGYVEGISNIIVKNLKQLDITNRPVHCTDKKRETMYIKDEDKWEKDENNVKLHKLVRKVAAKNQRLLPKFKEEHPDCLSYHSKYSDQYNKTVYESKGGKGDDEFEKEEKIIKKISKEVTIDK